MKLKIASLLMAGLMLAGCRAKPYEPTAPVEEMVGQMIMIGFRGMEPTEVMPAIESGKIGGVILFDQDATTKSPRNIESPEQLEDLIKRAQAAAPVPLFIAVDQEGGKVARLKPEKGFWEMPSAKEMGRGSTAVTYREGLTAAEEMKQLGINVNFAPVVDIELNPKNPTIAGKDRTFGTTAKRVTDHAKAITKGFEKGGIIFALKHFPGHGSALADTHMGLADITNTWTVQELVPYGEILREDMPGMVMVGHLYNKKLDAVYPASLSKLTIKGLLREQMKWDGVVITDDLQMKAIVDHYSLEKAIVLALQAEVDIILVGNNLEYDPEMAEKVHAIIMKAVKQRKVPVDQIDRSYNRIMKLKKKF